MPMGCIVGGVGDTLCAASWTHPVSHASHYWAPVPDCLVAAVTVSMYAAELCGAHICHEVHPSPARHQGW